MAAFRKFLEILFSLLGYLVREGVCYILVIVLGFACFIPGMLLTDRFNIKTVFGIDVWLLYLFIVLPVVFWIVYGVLGDFMKRLSKRVSNFLLTPRPERPEAVITDEKRERL